MNRTDPKERLLNEVLAEGGVQTLRDELLAQTLRQVRRRRRARQVRRTVGALIVVLGLGFLVWPRPHQPLVQPRSPRPYVVVQTRPLSRAAVVTTVPPQAASQVESIPTTSIVATATTPRLAREIDDADLLSLAAPNPVVLVRVGPHSAELVFAHVPDADDAKHHAEPQ